MVTQPCCYWVFQDYLYGLETQENEYNKEIREEEIKVCERGQPWLAGTGGWILPGLEGKNAYRTVKRRELPPGHPDYIHEGTYGLQWDKAQDIISKCWFDTLEEHVDDRYYNEKRENKIKLSFDGVSSPKYYNYSGDACCFTLSIPKPEMNRIIKLCLIDNEAAFSAFVRESYSSYMGFISSIPGDIFDYLEYWKAFKANKPLEGGYRNQEMDHLFWACLGFWLFTLAGGGNDFNASLWRNVTDAEGNGMFANIMNFIPAGPPKDAAV